ncbi:hypothetical protein OV090_42740 [Nannocystis sp. RBIL2]|uniref:hypothetical protein n=1 Tax=Nannocystis sp. RBIL2 TaxID=2996788 RepID=UPI00226F7A21|nr:hypothetical protein [Nannocystis sp. RBIL2]MCY1071538.1 hypothetical protein [Nannocystis sp. RBIL2]
MTTYQDTRAELAARRAAHAQLAAQQAARREQLKEIKRRLAAIRRSRDVDDPVWATQHAALEQQATVLQTEIDANRVQLAHLRSVASSLQQTLAAYWDPAAEIQQLDDDHPILLFPLRLETRFKEVIVNNVTKKQLWVRVYPDECQIDAFEELLSAAEVASGRAFWSEMWQAGGFEAQERGAWRALVASHGSGRAEWIVKTYAPTNLAAKPVKANPEDVVLVVFPAVTLPATHEAAACTFWETFWKADGDAAMQAQALAALAGAVQDPTVVDTILKSFAPENLAQEPPGELPRASVHVKCAKLLLAPPAAARETSWSQAPKAWALPDRFVLMAYNNDVEVKRVVGNVVADGLAVGPDRSLPSAEQLHAQQDELVLNEDLRWTVDFERAVDVGMGFKVDLDTSLGEDVNGFERLVVLGVRFSADHAQGKTLLETLFAHHHHSKRGLSLVPQGSPTNNTEGDGAAYSWADDADASFDVVLKGKEAFVETADPFARSDGEWLARYLGVATAGLKSVPHANGRDQAEARAMNTALWTATLGYFMEEMMPPVFSDGLIDATRRFFLRHVSGRGPLPAVRVGRQPYGILPAMAFSQYQPSGDGPAPLTQSYLVKLHGVLAKMDVHWDTLAQAAAHVGAPGDAHKTLLDILGLHPGSVEYHQRYAQSLDMALERLKWQCGGGNWSALNDAGDLHKAFLSNPFGFNDPNARPPIVDKYFFEGSVLLQGPVVDDVPLSETAPIRVYTPDGHNYIEWLAESKFDAIRLNDLGQGAAPSALLYLMLRHALMLGYWEAAIRLLHQHSLVDPAIARREPAFLHLQPIVSATEALQNKLIQLYRVEKKVTGDDSPLVEFIERAYPEGAWGADLAAMLRALDVLKDTPTSRLERLLAEHVDCASYRLDAWKTGLAALRREQMLGQGQTGIYLGAYGWLEGVKPRAQQLAPATLTPDQSAIFAKPGQAPLVEDSGNGGYIHAPSINHAATAAILKNAYMVNASDASPEAQQRMAVNLSSERVRRALALLEGVRNGQSLAALLGYRFERGLHDRHGLAEVDQFIGSLRQQFPLVADKLNSTKSDGQQEIESLEARNVVDGLRLAEHVRASGKLYPNPSSPAETAINAEVDALLDLHDAVSDLLMAESVYQVVQGNFERSAANTAAFSKGKYPPEPEVVRTPRSGTTLTHRVVLHLDPAAAPPASPTPRAAAEAPLNAWLAARLPDPAVIACQVTYTGLSLLETHTIITLNDLGLSAIDLLHLDPDAEQAMTELDDRIEQFLRYHGAHPAYPIRIHYAQPVVDNATFFELAPLIASLRSLALKSRFLGPTDVGLPTETVAAGVTYEFAELAARINAAAAVLEARRTTLLALVADPADLDDYVHAVTDALLGAALHGVPNTGTGDIHSSVRAIFQAVIAKVGELVTRWDEKAFEYAAKLATFSPLATEEEQFAVLLAAEGTIASTTTVDLPAQPLDFKTAVEAKKALFDARLAAWKDLQTAGPTELVDYVAAVEAQALLAAQHDAAPLDIEDQKAAMIALRADLVARVEGLAEELATRIASATAGLAEAAAIDHAEGRVRRMLAAAGPVLGDEIKLLPRFTLSPVRGAELENSLAGAPALLDYLSTTRNRRFPVDDWLYGAARVRDKLLHWENAVTLAEAFTGDPVELTALQLPYRTDDHWLGLEIPHGYAPTGDRLLYTAHFAGPFHKAAPQCGLLIDEWTEVIPAKDQVTGVTFHFDRPRAAPPQAMLLVVPPVLTGTWHWEHVVGALHETLAAAKRRAVEPDKVGNLGYGQFLPATMMATTLYQVTIATNIAFNNNIYDQFGG